MLEKERNEALAELENAISSESEARESLLAAEERIDALEKAMEMKTRDHNDEIGRVQKELEAAEGNAAEIDYECQSIKNENANLKSLVEKKEVVVHELGVKVEVSSANSAR